MNVPPWRPAWAGSLVAVLVAHGGALAWLADASPAPPPDAAPLPPVLMEVALAVPPPPAEPAPIAAAERPAEPAPPATPEPAALPPAKPPPPVPAAPALPPPRPLAAPRRPPPRPAGNAATPAAAPVSSAPAQPPTAEAVPAPAAAVMPSGPVISRWQARLMARLYRHRQYPEGARAQRQEGVVHLRFTMDREGQVLATQIARSSGNAALDAEALALAPRAAPLPAPPEDVPGATLTLTVPVQFSLR